MLFLAVAVTSSRSLPAQSLNDFQLGGTGSALVPAPSTPPKLTVSLSAKEQLTAGATLTLAIKAELATDAYTYSQNPSFGGATKITVTEVFGLDAIDDQFIPDHPPKVVFESAFKQDVEKFPGGVSWQRRYRLVGNVPVDQVYLAGTISYQVCDANTCIPLLEEFEVFPDLPFDSTAPTPDVVDGAPMEDPGASDDAPNPAELLESIVPATPSEASSTAGTDNAPLVFDLGEEANEASLPWYLLMAFLGGVVLNVMPCVLPVLAIKMMSFVQQAGESRGRILALNVSYSLGVIGVFLLLASLAVTLQMSWGGLFQLPEFNLVMIAIVFAMGLSLMGVYEIPIPGMIGSAGGQHREGLLGAFLTGVFATLLATPCTGPFMGPALAWSLRQEPEVVYLVWGVLGLGMAFPYLVVGMKPAIAHRLPKPGMWMVRAKEFSGIILMGATVWLLHGMEEQVVIPILCMLVGLALALWMIGSLYDHAASSNRKWTVRGMALAVVGIVGFFGFDFYEEGMAEAKLARQQLTTPAGGDSETGELPWEPFSTARLEALLRAGKPVLVDFTADWCANCKANEENALNTVETLEFVRQNDVTTLYADFTRKDAEIKRWLDAFNAIGVPLTVIFREGDPQRPIILRGIFFQDELLDSLREAVSSNIATENRQSARLVRPTAR